MIRIFPFCEGLYQASVKPVPDETMHANLATTKISLAQAHRVLGHIFYMLGLSQPTRLSTRGQSTERWRYQIEY